jgi:HEAT repeat protein
MLAFVIHNGPTGGLLYLDALQLDRSDKAGVEALIRKLGAEEFEEREEATRELLRVGPPDIEALREALDSPDAEVVTRARQILEQLGAVRKAEPGPETLNGVNVWTDGLRR